MRKSPVSNSNAKRESEEPYTKNIRKIKWWITKKVSSDIISQCKMGYLIEICNGIGGIFNFVLDEIECITNSRCENSPSLVGNTRCIEGDGLCARPSVER